ncbi:CesT family type III secretion system chaperone [Uliginosibacterium gangwonense]|uniref:CesT family type III secretion system chaperone n=1 Tax=Uliginosibacterium gangwonense TaxID=392736 RepID=UPI00037F0A02|nr:CesT family type III secretion system chaperone [Uliginosibacterium gangwonense]
MLSPNTELTQTPSLLSPDEDEFAEYGPASEYCLQLLKDASRLLQNNAANWNDEAGCFSFAGHDHYLLPADPDVSETELVNACYMMRLPIAIGDEPWAVYMLELNLMLVANTGFSLAVDDEHGLVLVKQLAGSHLNPMTLASTVEAACDVIDAVIRDYLFEAMDPS